MDARIERGANGSRRYGMTIDHVATLDVVLSDGTRANLGPVDPAELERLARPDTLEGRLYRAVPPLITANTEVIRTGFPPHWRRSRTSNCWSV